MRRMYSENQIDSQIKGVIEGGQVDNAKPIYCHPLRLYNDSGETRYAITCLIFNNDSTPFTSDTFKAWLDDLTTALDTDVVIMASGYYKSSTAEITSISNIFKQKSSGNYGLNGGKYNTLGVQTVSNSTWTSLFPSVALRDAVNKIN